MAICLNVSITLLSPRDIILAVRSDCRTQWLPGCPLLLPKEDPFCWFCLHPSVALNGTDGMEHCSVFPRGFQWARWNVSSCSMPVTPLNFQILGYVWTQSAFSLPEPENERGAFCCYFCHFHSFGAARALANTWSSTSVSKKCIDSSWMKPLLCVWLEDVFC